jgi:hypothetical protein
VGRLPFVRTEEGVAPGQAQEMSNETAAIRRAESMSRDPANAGALAFKRSGDPNMGNFGDATIAELQHDVRATIAKLLYSASGDVPHRAGAGGGSDISMVSHGGGFLARMPRMFLAWLSDADLDFYAGEFARTGFRGGLNWFRNVDRNWDLLAPFAGAKVTVPALYMAGEDALERARRDVHLSTSCDGAFGLSRRRQDRWYRPQK